MVTSIAFETDDPHINAGPWLVRIRGSDGSSVATGPWEHAEALAFAASMARLDGVSGQVVVEPLFGRPDLNTARGFLTDRTTPPAEGITPAGDAAG